MDSKRRAKFEGEELRRLIGGARERHVRLSLRRLASRGLLAWSSESISFPVAFDDVLRTSLDSMLAAITNNLRRVPVPRRILRLLAGEASRAVAATVLAHLLRCLYFRNRGCNPSGACKASWAARVFRVDSRNIKAARKKLIEIGWLVPQSAPQWRLNRYGAAMSVNLEWGRESALEASSSPNRPSIKAPPPKRGIITSLPPPESDQKLLSEYQNQKPACGSRPGFLREESKSAKEPPPRWEQLVAADFRSLDRLLLLFEQAAARKLVADSEAGRLAFVAAAEHARLVGRSNPCGLFRTVVAKRLWHFVTQEAEDSARRRLNARAAALAGKASSSNDCRPIRDVVGSVLSAIPGLAYSSFDRSAPASTSRQPGSAEVAKVPPRASVPRGERSSGLNRLRFA
jgi:hypothetical protein